jgi:glycerophosphoryl diester phosphodiesterase
MEWLRPVSGRVAVVAHRGAHAYAPENTMAAFRLAHELGADAIELDVHLSADERLVVMHDDTLDRTTSGSGLIGSWTWDDLSRLSAGAWYAADFAAERLPLLEEVLDWARQARMPLSIELKRPNAALGRAAYPDLGARVLALVDQFGLRDDVLLFSDDHSAVREVRNLAPSVATSITLGGAMFLDPVGIARDAGADGIAIYWSYASRQLVEACHAARLHVFGFGLGDDLSRRVELEAMLANGTDFLSGGAPDKLREIVDAWTSRVGSPA